MFGGIGAASEFSKAYTEYFGKERGSDALALLHGFDNATTRRAQALWELSRLVRADGALRSQLVGWAEAGPPPEAGGFAEALRSFLEEWGETVDRFVQDTPSWAEEPAPVVRAILTQAGMPDGEGPADRQAAAASRRSRLETELGEVAAADSGAARARELLPAAQEQPVVTEDHNVLCDQRLAAISRARWLRIGAYLVGRGAVAEPGDVFYHAYDELITVLEGGAPLAADEIARRRALQVAYREASPPPFLGRSPADVGPADSGEQSELRGLGVSPGRHRGRARIAFTVEEAWALEPGDVLVCVATSPAWTPLFAIAGAVVTESGGALSHPAVVAREFGIPAVVACRGATTSIATGATVEVDGAAGTVCIVR